MNVDHVGLVVSGAGGGGGHELGAAGATIPQPTQTIAMKPNSQMPISPQPPPVQQRNRQIPLSHVSQRTQIVLLIDVLMLNSCNVENNFQDCLNNSSRHVGVSHVGGSNGEICSITSSPASSSPPSSGVSSPCIRDSKIHQVLQPKQVKVEREYP